jgi:eukaryotic-like serine/threonine-protein kinase
LTKPDDEFPKDADLSTPIGRAERSSARSKSEPERGSAVAGMFSAGQILADRFRIVRLLGHGGMGEVYEAEDLELGKRVALKTLLPHLASDEDSLERFRREVISAQSVAHPNVCRIFDVFRHGAAATGGSGTSRGGTLFLTMEFLQGQTLAEALGPDTAKKQMSCEEALPIALQMIDALAAAHNAKVIHRDFKPANVMLVPRPGDAVPRVVVTDFGLARLVSTEDAQAFSLTAEGDSVGTPYYMAPEQDDDGEISPATDIFSLGVVLYEMVTAQRPFQGTTRQALRKQRRSEKPVPPRTIVPALDTKWNAVILRCLERIPADRFQNVKEVAEALEGETGALRRRTQEQRRRLRFWSVTAACALIVIVVGYFGYQLLASRLRPAEKKLVGDGNQHTVAIVRLENSAKSLDANWIETSLAESLGRELGRSGKLRVIPPEDVARMRSELKLPEGDSLDENSLGKIRADLGVDRVIVGSYETLGGESGGQLQVKLLIQDTDDSTSSSQIVRRGKEDDLFALSEQLGTDLRQQLGGGEISGAARDELRATVLNGTAADRAYSNGLEKLREFDPQGARDFLQQAVKLSPEAPLPHFALADAWHTLGYDEAAIKESRRAVELSGKLPRSDRIAIDCRALELARSDWDKATLSCKSLWDLYGNVTNGLRLADVQFAAERYNDSLKTLDEMRQKLPKSEREDARIDLSEAVTRQALTDYAGEQAAAEKALSKARQQGAKLLEARALLWRCMALQNHDKLTEAQSDCENSLSFYYVAGDGIGQARALTQIAHLELKQGHTDVARKKYADALKLATSIGSMVDRCGALLNFGGALLDRLEFGAARKEFEESLQIARESGNRSCEARSTENLGLVAQ